MPVAMQHQDLVFLARRVAGVMASCIEPIATASVNATARHEPRVNPGTRVKNPMKQSTVPVLVAIAIFALQPAARAEGPLESEMTGLRVVVDEKGQEQLVVADTAEPGDLVEYQLSYHNSGDQALSGLAITGPVPANTEYVAASAGSATPHEQLVSIDAGESFETEPVKRVERQRDGTSREVVVPPGAYTHLRWLPRSPIAPGETQVFRYRVRIR
jgi:uncharacterized repeat protein (TIGR01451 family)